MGPLPEVVVRNPKREAPRGAGLSATSNRRERIRSQCPGGETGIRTLDTFDRILDFESSAFDHSAISPVCRTGAIISAACSAREGVDPKKHCEKIFSKVLFPTDFSQPAEAALSFLKGLPGIGELLLLHVVSRGETEEEIEANVAKARQKINELFSELSKDGMNVKAKVVVGHPVEAIRYEAEMQDVSLIAISSQGAVAIKKGRIGSTAYDVANSASRPVLILRRSKIALYYI